MSSSSSWSVHHTSSSVPYYHNRSTNLTTWVQPTPMMTKEEREERERVRRWFRDMEGRVKETARKLKLSSDRERDDGEGSGEEGYDSCDDGEEAVRYKREEKGGRSNFKRAWEEGATSTNFKDALETSRALPDPSPSNPLLAPKSSLKLTHRSSTSSLRISSHMSHMTTREAIDLTQAVCDVIKRRIDDGEAKGGQGNGDGGQGNGDGGSDDGGVAGIFLDKNNSVDSSSSSGGNGPAPSLSSIVTFYTRVRKTIQLSHDCVIISLIYMDRLSPRVRLSRRNYMSVIFSCMTLSSKVWDDLSMWNVDFSRCLPETFTLRRVNQLEVALLSELKYNVKVTASSYARYYFKLRSMLQGSGRLPIENPVLTVMKARTLSLIEESKEERGIRRRVSSTGELKRKGKVVCLEEVVGN